VSVPLKTPIALITGSLGSGKTTLLRRILTEPPEKTAILMNEFGEIAIDSKIIQGEHIEVVELAGGCVCCSLTGEFEAAVKEIISRLHPNLIIVEATGVAESDALVFEVEDRMPEIRLDSVVCVVDAYAAVAYPQIGYAARTQLASADLILINKMDLVPPEDVESVINRVRRHNPNAGVLRAVRCEAPMEVLFSPPTSARSTPPPQPRAETFDSFSYTSENRLDRDKFLEFVATLPKSVYRAKGFARFPDGSCLLLNYVAGRSEYEAFAPETTRLVFIGLNLRPEQEAILARLRACEA
jgi:G3E family GTPase